MVLVECTCKPDQPYVDGAMPSFYEDEKKASYMFTRLSRKALDGMAWIQKELIILPDGSTRNGLTPFQNLKDYNLYFGVHLHGLHMMKP